MSLATRDTGTHTGQSMSAPPHRAKKPVSTQRYRADVFGASALLIAGVGLAGTLLLLQTSSVGPTTPATVGVPALLTPPVRDQWYLERASVLAGLRAALPASAMKDRWYDDLPTTAIARASVPAVRDQWYLEASVPRSVPSTSTQARDRWYLDGR
jgi:hypothetical protein